MQDPGLCDPESDHRSQPACSVEMVVVGHVGLATTQTSYDKRTSAGGSGYAVATSAAALIADRVGLVAQIGEDFELGPLQQLGIDLDGVAELPGPSARLCIEQLDNGTRFFSAELGVASSVRLDSFPPSYLNARYIHLATAPPEQQLTWLQFLHDRGSTAQVSADMFEHYVASNPDASRKVCGYANLIFMNEAEYEGLYGHGEAPAPKAPLILKRGSAGASICVDGLTRDVGAPTADVVDPTGAGEILAGVFLALFADGLPEVRALEYATMAAASCVEEFGVRGPRLIRALTSIRQELLRKRSTGTPPIRANGLLPPIVQ